MAVRIEIDGERCMGSGSCAFYAPHTFDLGEDMIAVVVDPSGDPDERIRAAADGCPTRAIRLVDGGAR